MSEELLVAAKRRFFTELMENDLIAGLIMEAAKPLGGELPDFQGEPWLPEGDTIGLCLESSGSGRDSYMSFTVGIYAHLRLVVVSHAESDKTLLVADDVVIDGSDELMAADATREEKQAAARKFVQLWQEFYRTIREFEVYLDPMFHVFTTEQRHYSSCK